MQQHEYGNLPETQLAPEIIQVESREVAAARLRQLPVVEPTSEAPDVADVFVAGHRSSGGNVSWFGASTRSGIAKEIQATPDNHDAFRSAEAFVREADAARPYFEQYAIARDGFWWAAGQPGNLAERAVEGSLREVFRFDAGQGYKPLDILNCSDRDLSEDERTSIEYAVNGAVALSKGKLLDGRLAGIILGGANLVDGEDKSGGFRISDRIIRVDINNHRGNPGDFPPRYAPYFPERREEVTTLAADLAHEMGHPMDTVRVREAVAHGIKLDQFNWVGVDGQTPNFSAFQQHFGWEGKALPDSQANNSWRLDDAAAVEARETPLTGYGFSEPAEDFAETFAVTALGGDVSTAPGRQRILRQTIDMAEGRATEHILPATLQKQDVDAYPPKQLQALRLHVALI